ncbi:serine/threonine protein kinase KIN, putative (KIN) [Plasmodium ovale curtisi]|uniref:Serine/threonine protein kinase KIN, putative (KIN) n=1 Tax=Plasmodium ovale curtisi TaxID=864141 RepID=A0A1A8W144_PLAOA|nr:serine/threonine protein kinase KIN, putative (KIN) [Plasmodium ovale curtisi]SBS97011.1 serine/threonine protein kinase KIN, putative (KIN) [Plasmodium ovale curtisi]
MAIAGSASKKSPMSGEVKRHVSVDSVCKKEISSCDIFRKNRHSIFPLGTKYSNEKGRESLSQERERKSKDNPCVANKKVCILTGKVSKRNICAKKESCEKLEMHIHEMEKAKNLCTLSDNVHMRIPYIQREEKKKSACTLIPTSKEHNYKKFPIQPSKKNIEMKIVRKEIIPCKDNTRNNIDNNACTLLRKSQKMKSGNLKKEHVHVYKIPLKRKEQLPKNLHVDKNFHLVGKSQKSNFPLKTYTKSKNKKLSHCWRYDVQKNRHENISKNKLTSKFQNKAKYLLKYDSVQEGYKHKYDKDIKEEKKRTNCKQTSGQLKKRYFQKGCKNRISCFLNGIENHANFEKLIKGNVLIKGGNANSTDKQAKSTVTDGKGTSCDNSIHICKAGSAWLGRYGKNVRIVEKMISVNTNGEALIGATLSDGQSSGATSSLGKSCCGTESCGKALRKNLHGVKRRSVISQLGMRLLSKSNLNSSKQTLPNRSTPKKELPDNGKWKNEGKRRYAKKERIKGNYERVPKKGTTTGNVSTNDTPKVKAQTRECSSKRYKIIVVQNNNEEVGHYIITGKIGKGTFGKVCLGIHMYTCEIVAIKILNKKKLLHLISYEKIMKEIKIHKNIEHNHICRFYEVHESKNNLYMILEYLPNGDLLTYVYKNENINENSARRILYQLISAIDYLHKNSIVHRDLKPENILLDYNNNVKLIDFGLSTIYKKNSLLTTSCGSPFYTSPEILLGNKYHAELTDVWSLGVILFLLLNRKLPFNHNDLNQLFLKIIKGILHFEPNVSPSAKNLIQNMLNVNYKKRYSLFHIKRHSWFCNHNMKKINMNCSGDGCNLMDCSTCLYVMITKNNVHYNDLIISRVSKVHKIDKDLIHSQLNSQHKNFVKTTYYLLLNKTTRMLSENSFLHSHYALVKGKAMQEGVMEAGEEDFREEVSVTSKSIHSHPSNTLFPLLLPPCVPQTNDATAVDRLPKGSTQQNCYLSLFNFLHPLKRNYLFVKLKREEQMPNENHHNINISGYYRQNNHVLNFKHTNNDMFDES